MRLEKYIKKRLNERSKKRLFQKAAASPPPENFTYYPEPTDLGDYSRGLRWLSGDYFHEHQMISAPAGRIWDMAPVSLNFLNSLHAFDWMNDLAAVGTSEADVRIRSWTNQWYELYGHGEDPAWEMKTAAWRLIRLITHAFKLLRNCDAVTSERYYHSLGIHVKYLSEYAGTTRSGIERVSVLAAWTFATISLDEYADDLDDLVALIDEEAIQLIDGQIVDLESRNPEELSEIFCLLVWLDTVLADREIQIGSAHSDAIEVIGKTLRGLRLGTGKLLEAHGGGPGQNAAIERAIATAQIQGSLSNQLALGFANIRANKLTVLMDCAAPAHDKLEDKAAASTLGLWVIDNNQPLVLSEGCAKNHNLTARISVQETHAYSALCIDGQSSSTFEFADNKVSESAYGAWISHPSQISRFELSEDPEKTMCDVSQDGFENRFGLSHERKLSVDRDGEFFAGVDILRSLSPEDEAIVRRVLKRKREMGIPFSTHFILGPKVKASLDMNSQSVSLKMPSGKVWIFRQMGGSIELEDRNIYDVGRINPIPTKAIVIHSRLVDISGYVSWSFQAYNQE